MRDSEEMKVDGQNHLNVDDLKRQKVDGLKSSLHYLLSVFELSAESIGPLTFMLRTVIYGRESRDSDTPYSLLETIQFKSSPCTLE